MAVANTFTFGNINTKDFGVVVEGYGNYTAPKRAVEMVTVPGRDGSIAIDQGRYEDGSATYSVIIRGKTQYEFARKVSEFRNAIISQLGYQRLTEDYLPGEYRMAIYAGGLESDPDFIGRAGRFEVKFTCKPRRYLLSGETEMSVDSGDSVYNPTPYGSSPLIAAEGPGVIHLGDHAITINDVVVGTVKVNDKITLQNQNFDRTWDINDAKYNPGDLVTIPSMTVRTSFTITNGCWFEDTAGTDRVMGIEYYNTVDSDATLLYNKSGKTANYGITIPSVTLTIGQNLSKTYRIRATVIVANDAHWWSNRLYCDYTISYSNSTLRITASRILFNASGDVSSAAPRETCTITLGAITGESTLSTLTDTIYLDCDLGDAYVIKDEEHVSLNSTVQFGSDLPQLVPGDNPITYENTITSLSITPRWWTL